MTINKNTDLEFSLQKGTEKGGVYTNFYTEDKGSASIRIRLSSNGYYLDLTKIDLKPVLFLFHEDGSIFEIKDFMNVMPDKGLIQYNLSDNVIAHAGKVKAKLFLKNTKQSVHVANFTFNIKDSGIEGAVAKEVNVNIVDDAVRRIVKENAIEILGDDFEERLNTDVVKHLDNKPELFKGPKGDIGPRGYKGDKGNQGYRGKPFTFGDFTPEQIDSLRTNIIPGEKETIIVDKGVEDSFIVYPPNGEDFRLYPNTINDEYFHSGTIKSTTPTNSVNADSSFKIDSGGYLFYAVKTKDELAPGNKFSIEVEVENKDDKLLLQYAILDSEGGYIEYITPLRELSANTYGLEEYVIPQGAAAIQFRVDARQVTGTSSIKSFYLFEGKFTKEEVVASDEDVFKGILEEIDKLKIFNNDDKDEEFNIPVFTPLNFTEKNHLLNDKIFTDGKGKFKTNIDMNDYKLSGGKYYYVDGENGNDTNDGLSKSTPFKTFRKALGIINNGDTLYVSDGDYFRVGGTLLPPISNKSINIIGLGTNVNLFMADEPTWTKTSGRDNTYEFTRSAVRRVVDFNNDKEFTNVASLDEVDTTVFSWYSDGKNVYVNNGSIEPNKKTIPFLSSQHLIVSSVPTDFYIENLNLYGGARPARFELNQDNSVYINNCTLNYASQVNGNGLEIVGGKNIVLNNCTANNNSMDGFNYHIGTDGSKPFIIEIDCTGLNNGIDKGTAGVKSNNGTTIHDGLKGIRVNGLYGRNDGGNVADVNEGTETWNLACVAFESYQGKDFQTSSGSHMWLDNCIAYGSGNSINSGDTNSKIYTRLGDYQNKLIIGEEIKY